MLLVAIVLARRASPGRGAAARSPRSPRANGCWSTPDDALARPSAGGSAASTGTERRPRTVRPRTSPEARLGAALHPPPAGRHQRAAKVVGGGATGRAGRQALHDGFRKFHALLSAALCESREAACGRPRREVRIEVATAACRAAPSRPEEVLRRRRVTTAGAEPARAAPLPDPSPRGGGTPTGTATRRCITRYAEALVDDGYDDVDFLCEMSDDKIAPPGMPATAASSWRARVATDHAS